jgi:SAM-dependent methyltransferase
VGQELNLFGSKHTQVNRDYLGRVTSPSYPKFVAAELAKKWDYDYWDGDRQVNYGGYRYIEGHWTPLANRLIEFYGLTSNSSILDVGCGKGYLLFEIQKLLPGIRIAGLDISEYAIKNSPSEVFEFLIRGSAVTLPWDKKTFDLVVSINTLHNLYNYELELALKELARVAHRQYLVVESYRNELEKMNLLYWQVTCEAFCTPEEWQWWFESTHYMGDYEFIFFN